MIQCATNQFARPGVVVMWHQKDKRRQFVVRLFFETGMAYISQTMMIIINYKVSCNVVRGARLFAE